MKEEIRSSLHPELIAAAARQWAATEEATLLDDVTNMVYEFKYQEERRILRLTHSSHQSEDEIIAELDWLNFLIQRGVPASRPLPSTNGRLTERYPVQDSYFVASVFEYAPGHFVHEANPQEWNPAFFQAWGGIMGRMHRLTKEYNPQHLRQKRPHWVEDECLRNAAAYLPPDQRQAATDLEKLLAQFRHITPTGEDYGLVHNDVNPTNFHVNDGQITLFDFDDCAYNWFINDIAVTMPLYSDLFDKADWKDGLMEFLRGYMRGYAEENHLDEGWLDYLPVSLRMQNIITLVALHQANIPNSQYHSFYELVLKIYLQGHPLFSFDFRQAYRSLV